MEHDNKKMELAKIARDNLLLELNRPNWLNGVGITIGVKNPNEYAIQVGCNQITDEVKKIVPQTYCGHEVVLVERGIAKAQTK